MPWHERGNFPVSVIECILQDGDFNFQDFLQNFISIYRSTSLSQSPREWRKYFELSEIRHSQNVTSPKYSIHVEFR